METGKHDEVSYEHIAAFLNIFVYRPFIVAVQCGFRLASVSLCRGLNHIQYTLHLYQYFFYIGCARVLLVVLVFVIYIVCGFECICAYYIDT